MLNLIQKAFLYIKKPKQNGAKNQPNPPKCKVHKPITNQLKKTSHYMYSKDAVTSNYVLQCSRIPLYNKPALKGKPLYNKPVLKYTSL